MSDQDSVKVKTPTKEKIEKVEDNLESTSKVSVEILIQSTLKRLKEFNQKAPNYLLGQMIEQTEKLLHLKHEYDIAMTQAKAEAKRSEEALKLRQAEIKRREEERQKADQLKARTEDTQITAALNKLRGNAK